MRGDWKRAGLLCGAITLCLVGVREGHAQKKLTIERLYTLPWVIGTKPESPQWSADSKRVAFLWNDEGTNFYDVWMTDVESGKPVRVTRMPQPEMPRDAGTDVAKLEQVERAENDHGVTSVLWAPDQKHLIFGFHGQLYWVLPGQDAQRLGDVVSAMKQLASEADAVSSPRTNQIAFVAQDDLWVADLDAAHPTAKKIYSPGKKDVGIEEFHWSGDGKRIAFIEADLSHMPVRGIPDYLGAETKLNEVKRPFPGEPSEWRRVGIIAADGGDVTWAELGSDPQDLIFDVAWSPDSAKLLIDKSDLYIKDRRLLLVNPDTGKATLLLREQDPKNVTAEWWCDWASDGRGVYFISDRDNDYHIYYQALSGGEPKAVTGGKWAVFSASMAAPGNALIYVSNEGKVEERQVFRAGLSGAPSQRITSAAGTHTPVASPDGKYIADIFSNDTTPPDLYLQATTAGSVATQVTHSPLSEFKEYNWVAAKYVDFPNVNDGTMLHARLTLPPNFDKSKKYPAILGSVYSNTVHNQWGGRIFHPTWGLDQYLAQQGYVILNVDISGSSGYGKLFRQRIREDYGGVDVEDLYSGVRYLVSQGYVDEHRVGIWGSSYGGLLTATSLFTKPGVYQAGVAGAPATSLFHALTGEMRTMMAPQDHMAQYAKSSAFLKSGGLRDHLMIIHGMKDDTVLFKDSVTLEERLILEGHDIDLLVLPNAPHGWDTEGMAQTRYAYRKLVDYFKRYLGEGPTP